MAKTDDGGKFHPTYSASWTPTGGLSLRDWFAGQAIHEVMGVELRRIDRWEERSGHDAAESSPMWDIGHAREWAERAYLVADAMLVARKAVDQ